MPTGEKIKILRQEKGWNQAELAHLAGISLKTVQRVERNHKISNESLKNIAAVFDMDIELLISEKTHISQVKEEFTRQADKIKASKIFNNAYVKDKMINMANVSDKDICLDLACGTGILTREIAIQARQVYALDVTEKMLKENRIECENKKIENVTFVKSDAENMPFEDKKFDKIITRLSIHHFKNPDQVLKEMFRVLKDNGEIIIGDIITSSEPDLSELHNAIEKLRDPTHVKAFSEEELRELIADYHYQIIDFYRYDMDRQYDEWLDITNNPERYEALFTVLRSFIENNIRTGMNLKMIQNKIHFKHQWLFLKLKKA